MLPIWRALVVSAVVFSAHASSNHGHVDGTTTTDLSWQRFSNLLDTVDESSLHQVLQAVYPKFRDGVYRKARTAAEQVHSENPIVASKLLRIAKRQTNDTTSTSSTSTTTTVTTTTISTTTTTTTTAPTFDTTSTSSPPTSSDTSSATFAIVPSSSTTVSSTNVQSTSSSANEAFSSDLSSILSAEITATSLPLPTTVNIPPSTPASATAIRTESQGVVFSSADGGLITLTSQVVYVSYTRITSTRTFYATQSNGEVQTRTSVVVVNAPMTASARVSAGDAATTSPGLQGGAGRRDGGGALMAFVLGVVGVLAIL